MLERMVEPEFLHAGPNLKPLQRADLQPIEPPHCIDRRALSDCQRLLCRPGRLTRSRIASRLHSTSEKLRPYRRTATLQLTRCRPALHLRMAEFDGGTIHIQQRAINSFPFLWPYSPLSEKINLCFG